MISSCSQLRAKGRADLKGRWAEAAMLTFVAMLISCFISAVGSALDTGISGPSAININVNYDVAVLIRQSGLGIFGLVFIILLIPMSWSFSVTFLANHRRESDDPFGVGNLFTGYKDFWRVFSSMFLVGLLECVCLLLLIIPGIWMSLRLALVQYILRDNPELSPNQVLRLSAEMMYGYKWKLFLLMLTFIGWGILCIFTLGIGYFWLAPYIDQTMANFYEEVKADYQGRKGEETCACL